MRLQALNGQVPGKTPIVSIGEAICRTSSFILFATALAVARLAGAEPAEKHCRYVAYRALPITFAGLDPVVEGTVNGKPMKMLVDTGAYDSFLFPEAVRQLDLKTRMLDSYGYGIGGRAWEYLSKIDEITIGPMHADKIDMAVMLDTPEELTYGVDLGARFLFQYDMEMSLAQQYLKFFAPDKCGKDDFLAYWDPNASTVPMKGAGDDRKVVPIAINEHKLRALIDSGATHSAILAKAARKIGISLEAPGVAQWQNVAGVGKNTVKSWIVPFDSFQIGDELIQKGKMLVIDSRLDDDYDVILGADFLRAHRLLFAVSQRRLYFSYLGGNVFYTSPQQDIAWYQKAAELGNADAQLNLASAYQTGNGVQQDDTQAFNWYSKAAEQGNARAQAALGYLCQYGKGTSKNEVQAFAWYRKAAEQKNPWGQFGLATMYQYGTGVTRDEGLALEWFLKAAQQGNRSVRREVGFTLYSLGKFAESAKVFEAIALDNPKDRYSRIWVYLAQSRSGNPEARRALEAASEVTSEKEWPAPLVDFYMGKMEKEALLAAARDEDESATKVRLCEAEFHLAENHLLQGDEKQAVPLLQVAITDCQSSSNAYEIAEAELSRLKPPDQAPPPVAPAAHAKPKAPGKTQRTAKRS